MKSDTTISPFPQPDAVDVPLTPVLREGARRLLAEARRKPRPFWPLATARR
jgi:putative transposase